jgi:ferredoxin
MRVVVDRERCQGHGRCHAIAPELFDLDELGYSVLRSEDADILPALAEIASLAAAGCPERAITVDQRNPGVGRL